MATTLLGQILIKLFVLNYLINKTVLYFFGKNYQDTQRTRNTDNLGTSGSRQPYSELLFTDNNFIHLVKTDLPTIASW